MKRGAHEGLRRGQLIELNFLVAEFLEKERSTLGRELRKKPETARQVYERLHRILFSNRPIPGVDLDKEVPESVDFKGLVLLYYDCLKQTWDSIKSYIFVHKDRIGSLLSDSLRLFEKAMHEMETILFSELQNAELNAGESEKSMYREINAVIRSVFDRPSRDGISAESMPHFEEIASFVRPLKSQLENIERMHNETNELFRSEFPPVFEELAAILREFHAKFFLEQEEQLFMPAFPRGDKEQAEIPMVRFHFKNGRIKFSDWHDPIRALIDIMDALPVAIFLKCRECGGCFVETRKGKEYCTHLCAATAVQKRRWQEDPEGSKQKERDRYQSRRKSSKAVDTGKKDGQ
jgi:hypothetical protein